MRKLPLSLCLIIFVFAILFSGLFPAHAATFYVDLGSALAARIPSGAYGGPAGLGAGDWNGIATSNNNINLFDIDGNSTSVYLFATGGWTIHSSPNSDSEKLLWDSITSPAFSGSYSLTFSNLTTGDYDVYLYAGGWASSYPTGEISVNGSKVTEFGPWGYQLVRTTVNSGTLSIIGTTQYPPNMCASLAGVQLRAVPIPGALWLLGSGVIGIAGIRRKFKKKTIEQNKCVH